MAALVKCMRLSAQFANKNPAAVYTIVRNHWNKDFKPGQAPQSSEEKEKAAKKYNLLPEEYKIYPEDGTGFGDYPKLPDISGDSKDPYYPYDFPEHKRNFNEPMHADADMIGEDRYDISGRTRYPMWVYYATFSTVMAVCMGIYYYLDDKRMFRPVVPKQLPGDGRIHYTFEPADAKE